MSKCLKQSQQDRDIDDLNIRLLKGFHNHKTLFIQSEEIFDTHLNYLGLIAKSFPSPLCSLWTECRPSWQLPARFW